MKQCRLVQKNMEAISTETPKDRIRLRSNILLDHEVSAVLVNEWPFMVCKICSEKLLIKIIGLNRLSIQQLQKISKIGSSFIYKRWNMTSIQTINRPLSEIISWEHQALLHKGQTAHSLAHSGYLFRHLMLSCIALPIEFGWENLSVRCSLFPIIITIKVYILLSAH